MKSVSFTQLLALQSNYGRDSRFKLDHRFAEADVKAPAADDDAEEQELDEEKQRQMSILGSLVPLAPAGRFNAPPGADCPRNRIG